MAACSKCRGYRKIRRPATEPQPIWWRPGPRLCEPEGITIRVVEEPCTECWGTGRGPNYDIVAERPTSLSWMQNEITRLLQGGKPEEMERIIGTAVDYDDCRWELRGVTLKLESDVDPRTLRAFGVDTSGLPKGVVTVRWAPIRHWYVSCRILEDLPTVPKGWRIVIKERTA